MSDESTTDYAGLAREIGVVQERVSNVLDGINDIKVTLSGHSEEIGNLKSDLAVLKSEHDVAKRDIDELKSDTKPEKGRFWAAISGLGVIVTLAMVILDRFYLPTH